MTTTIGSLDLNAFSDLYSDSNQYFWFESDATATYGAGAHVTLVPETSFISNPTGQNILMNTEGFSIRNGLLPMMTLDNDSLDFNVVNTTAGTYTTTATFTSTGAQIGQSGGAHLELNTNEFSIRNGSLPMMTLDNDSLDFNAVDTTAGTYVTTATFSSTGAQIGQSGESYLEMDYHSMKLIDREGNPYFYVSDLRGLDGKAHIVDTFISQGLNRYFLTYTAVSTDYTVTVSDGSGGGVDYRDTEYFDLRYDPTIGAIVTVEYDTESEDVKAYTVGMRGTGDVGGSSAIVGTRCVASGQFAYAEGLETTSSGYDSHAQNFRTIAGYDSQTAIGKYNDNQWTSAFEIGNGTSDNARSNALTVDWSGRVQCGDYSGTFKSIFDVFYPVGSYYETSLASAIPSGSPTPNATDLANLGVTWFDPQYAWGGTWELETAGQVHVSSGTGYVVNGALTNTSDGGSKDAAVISHYHNPSTTSEYFVCNAYSEANNTRVAYSSSGNRLVDGLTSTGTSSFHHRKATQTVGESGTNRNMQPYIIVNRWHRTA